MSVYVIYAAYDGLSSNGRDWLQKLTERGVVIPQIISVSAMELVFTIETNLTAYNDVVDLIEQDNSHVYPTRIDWIAQLAK